MDRFFQEVLMQLILAQKKPPEIVELPVDGFETEQFTISLDGETLYMLEKVALAYNLTPQDVARFMLNAFAANFLEFVDSPDSEQLYKDIRKRLSY